MSSYYYYYHRQIVSLGDFDFVCTPCARRGQVRPGVRRGQRRVPGQAITILISLSLSIYIYIYIYIAIAIAIAIAICIMLCVCVYIYTFISNQCSNTNYTTSYNDTQADQVGRALRQGHPHRQGRMLSVPAPKIEEPPIFDLRSRRSKNPPIFNLRSSAPKIEET